jgi:hypothetical protein
MVFFKSMAPGSTSPSEIRIKIRRALHQAHIAHRPNGTLRVFQCHSISIHFNQSATNVIIYMYIYITIYRYGIVAEGSETHHFRGRQNSPKEVPTCLIQKCASLAFLPQCDKKVFRQLAAASHSTSGLSLMLLKEAPHLFQACLEHWRRTWMPGLPGLSTTEAFFWACRRDVPGLVN